ncbi:MAG TPA: hypothetical protein VMY34_09480 [Acidimicrobiales bacterium]|nr:hypothetical protein [Acidimicrobiales bacterium]
MFVQVIEGNTSDPDGLRRHLDQWIDEMSASAEGYLGTTGGITADGLAIFLARFESEDAARRNSDRPEQSAWWTETAKCFDGDVVFRNCGEVDLLLDGGADDAGFVQVMRGIAIDKERLREMEKQEMPKLRALRPDLIGGITAWDGDVFTQAAYFTSEEMARKGEAAMEDEAAGGDGEGADWQSMVSDLTFMDLTDPWIRTR